MKTWQKALAAATMSTLVAGLPAMPANAASPIAPYGAIRAEWLAKGGASGFLGAPTSNEYSIPGLPGVRVEEFAGGEIYWSPATGAHEIHGAIEVEYIGTVHGPTGYGLPTTDETTTPDGVGRFNHFSGGESIYWTAATGAHAVYGAIREDWSAGGWERGPLGYPTQDEINAPRISGAREQDFTAGQEYWSPTTGAHEVHGAILAEYIAVVAPTFGLPLTDELTTPDGVGRFNHFSNGGSIYWTPATGAHEVHGAIRAEWAATGWEAGPTGYPLTDEMTTRDGVGRFNHFSKDASIYWLPTSGAHEVHGLIRSTWAATGWELGPLGYPVTDEVDATTGQDRLYFQHGMIETVNGVATVYLN
jgi:uncharacterized protein with LGFP repeats